MRCRWQNTRLPYGAMLAAGDFDTHKVILDYYVNMAAYLSQRTVLYWNHTGVWTTETQHLTGAYTMTDYGCSGRDGLPVWLEASGYLHVDWAGDSGTGEWAIMALDYYSYTGDSTYLPLAFAAADFLRQHFPNRTADGRVVVWPAQVLETYWCDYDTKSGTFVNCCADDAPTVSAMMSLFERLLALPPSLTSAQQRAEWAAFTSIMPRLPMNADNRTIAPARVLSSGSHNSEGPELYAMHPHRLYTVGRQVASGADISVGVDTVASSSWANGQNEGWNYGLNAAALVGNVELASKQVLARASVAPAAGYRFPGFASHYQDFDPSADHFANMNRALQEMLIQSGDDGYASPTIVLFPAWPCGWDVDFRLVGPLNTTVTVSYVGGKLASLDVQPPSRAPAVKWARCVQA